MKLRKVITEQFAATDEEIDALLGSGTEDGRIVKTEGHKILLVGAVERAFPEPSELSGPGVEIRRNVADAIEAATKEKFSVIAVVISGLSARLKTILKALNESSGGAKIVLLAQMYEEPIAKRLAGISSNGKLDFAEQANSYLICPIEAEEFYQAVAETEDRGQKTDDRRQGQRQGAEQKTAFWRG